ncbi:MAG TPA: hypothetical protein VNB52_02885 [Ilumatobacteraceae bacterium]|nr:hypothetical protein [Ilumatobacteraceae bacterium]
MNLHRLFRGVKNSAAAAAAVEAGQVSSGTGELAETPDPVVVGCCNELWVSEEG